MQCIPCMHGEYAPDISIKLEVDRNILASPEHVRIIAYPMY